MDAWLRLLLFHWNADTRVGATILSITMGVQTDPSRLPVISSKLFDCWHFLCTAKLLRDAAVSIFLFEMFHLVAPANAFFRPLTTHVMV